MTRGRAWWDGLSEPERFRFYTRVTTEAAIATVAVAMAASMRGPWPMVAVIVVAVASFLAIESRPELTSWPTPAQRTRIRVLALALLTTVTVASVVVVRTADDAAVDDSRTAGLFAVLVAAMALAPFTARPWTLAVGLGALSGLAFGTSLTGALMAAVVVSALTTFMVAMMMLTLWALRVVEDLERARSVEAELQVTQERLRFARDLHDVVGRGFSAVAVKSELAATLARAGETGRATTEMEEVKSLAVESMEQMRSLVRGYRGISLASEVAGAGSLLQAAGCRLDVQGDAERVPATFHEVAAWVVREGTTNIVKHTSATRATLTLGPEGMSLRNDGTTTVGPARSGHQGLTERLAAVGASMSTQVTGDEHVLEVRWEASA